MPTDRQRPSRTDIDRRIVSSGSEVYASAAAAVAALKQKRRSIWVQVRGASAFSFFVRLSHGKSSSSSVTVLENVLDKRVSYFNSVVVVAVAADDDDDSSG